MPSSQELWTNLQPTLQQLAQYNQPVNTQGVTNDLASRVNFFRPQIEDLNKMDAQAYAGFGNDMKQFGDTYGGGGYGPTFMNRLQAVTNNLASRLGTRNAMDQSLQYNMGTLGDLAKSIVEQNNAQRQNLADQRDYTTSLLNMASQREEAQKARDAAARQVASSRAAAAQPFDLNSLLRTVTANTTPSPAPKPVAGTPVKMPDGAPGYLDEKGIARYYGGAFPDMTYEDVIAAKNKGYAGNYQGFMKNPNLSFLK